MWTGNTFSDKSRHNLMTLYGSSPKSRHAGRVPVNDAHCKQAVTASVSSLTLRLLSEQEHQPPNSPAPPTPRVRASLGHGPCTACHLEQYRPQAIQY